MIIIPWLSGRKRLLTAFILDGIIFFLLKKIILNTSVITNDFNIFPELVIYIFWGLISYILGRYDSNIDKPIVLLLTSQIIQSISTVFISIIALFLFNSFSLAFYSSVINKSITFKFLVELSIISSFSQCILKLILNRMNNYIKHTLVLGSERVVEDLKKSIIKYSSSVKFKFYIYSKANEYKIDDFDEIIFDNTNEAQSLLNYFSSKYPKIEISILSLSLWYERYLNIIPSDSITLNEIYSGRFNAPNRLVERKIKRMADLILSIIIIVLCTPLMILICFAIKFDDGGPIFYSQMRTGFMNKPFRVWKFRSMKVNAEKGKAQWARKFDSRITAIGNILRKTRLDELPQLINVISGQMTLIGPRPERPEIDSVLEKNIIHYKCRYLVKPGLSGWAQVNYPYGASEEDSKAKLSLDLFYMRNFSILLDILILFKTMKLIFNAKGAIPSDG